MSMWKRLTGRDNKKPYWQFSPIPNIEESNFNKILERFYSMKVPGLVRENLQNSLDGKRPDHEGPVRVTIKTGTIEKNQVPGINEVIARISSLEGRNSYTKEAITHMQNATKNDEVDFISFEDENTKGLSGAKNGQSVSPQDTWAIYAYNKGVQSEEEDESVEISRGGSHGVGKIASNAASDLNIMYFANCDAYGDQHLGGTIQLIEHVYQNQSYRSTGYFADIEELGTNKSKFYPFENEFHEVFKKKTRGLKIIIPFFRKEYNDEREIIKSVIDSFFVSILEKKLEVCMNGKMIDANTITNYVNSSDYYIQNVPDMKKEFTHLYVGTYLNEEPRILKISDGAEEYEFNLYFRYDEEIPKGRVAIVRTIGMKIEDKKVDRKATQPFNAVLIGGSKEDAYLKSLENESHTQLSADDIKDPLLKKRAKKFISNLSKEMAKVIDEAIEERNPVDGAMDTSDILYVVENQFKQELTKAMGAVVINKKNPVVKYDDNLPPKQDRKGKKGTLNTVKKELIKPVKPGRTENEEESTEQHRSKYSVHPNTVERILMGNKEVVKFDLSSNKNVAASSHCNVGISIIDGMGQEDRHSFVLKENYEQIVDRSTGNECLLTQNKINDVRINQGVAELTFDLKGNFNKALKFVYYVEV